jgi:hypothetical protein
MRALRVLVPFAVLAAGMGGGTAAAEAPACDADVIVSVNDLHVVVDPVTEVVQAGQRARFEVTVSRPEGNLGGLARVDAPAPVPAAGVRAAVWIPLSPTPAAALGETGDDGTATIEVPIPSSSKAGTVDLRGFSWNTIINGCLTIEEVGQVDLSGALTIKPRRR